MTTGTVRFRSFLHNTVADVMKSRPGWRPTDHDTDWDIFWADVGWIKDSFDHMHLEDHQRVNHFRNHYELTRKDLMLKNLKRMKKQLEKEERWDEANKFDFIPGTYTLPGDYGLFVEEFNRKDLGSTWILKPSGRSQGKGIFLFTKLSQVTEYKKDTRFKPENKEGESKTISEHFVVQRYIENPYLVGGKKFDLRLYALVTSYSPLTVYLYRSGFARFSTYRFSMALKDVNNQLIHLTNNAVQKTASDYDKASGGCKWDLRSLKMYMISKHGLEAVNQLFYDIQMVVIRSLLSVQKIMINNKHCFELYGYDVIIDDCLKPWLIEVNASPSLTASTPEDHDLKFALLDDTMSVIDMERKLRGDEQQIGGYDLVYCDGPINNECGQHYMSNLGCHNPRQSEVTRARLQRQQSS